MNRQPFAMKTLIRQVTDKRPDVVAVASLPDGFGVYRTVSFDHDVSEWLAPIIEANASDVRIASHSVSDEGVLRVDFVTDHRADSSAPFRIKEAEAVLRSDGDRRAELQAMKAGDLREEFPEHASLPNKDAIVEAILEAEQ
jgi:hypothetical protein